MTQCCANFVELTSSEVPSSAPKSSNHFTHRTSGLWGQRGKLTFRAAGEVYAAAWNLNYCIARAMQVLRAPPPLGGGVRVQVVSPPAL